VNRRDLLILSAGTAIAWPLIAWAQQKQTPVIGFLGVGSPSGFAAEVAAFTEGLRDNGWTERKRDALGKTPVHLLGGAMVAVVLPSLVAPRWQRQSLACRPARQWRPRAARRPAARRGSIAQASAVEKMSARKELP
jgi:hypothetical protein